MENFLCPSFYYVAVGYIFKMVQSGFVDSSAPRPPSCCHVGHWSVHEKEAAAAEKLSSFRPESSVS